MKKFLAISAALAALALSAPAAYAHPDDTTVAIIKAIKYMERFEVMVDRILNVDLHDWNDLLLLPE